MPRMAREELLHNGCYAHIISRSIRKMKLMRDDTDFQVLNQLFLKTKQEQGYQIHHYCFMQTHFHLVVCMPKWSAFADAMRRVKSLYSHHFHSRYGLSGPIWRERYRALLIENEDYLYACGSYVENNPVEAGIVGQASGWKYSSWRYYHEGRADPLIDRVKGGASSGGGHLEIGEDPQEFFEKGKVIGSPFFRYLWSERMKIR